MRGLLAVFGAGAAVVAAQNYPDWQIQGWEVYYNEGECWLVHKPLAGGELSVSVSKHDSDFYVSAVRPNWDWVVHKDRYPLHGRFGRIDRTGNGGGLTRPGVSVIFPGSAVADSGVLLKAANLSVTVTGRDTFSAQLNATARQEFGKCIATLGGIGSDPDN